MGLVKVTVGKEHLGAAITTQAIKEMGLKQGDQVTAIIKATEVMLAKSTPPTSGHYRGNAELVAWRGKRGNLFLLPRLSLSSSSVTTPPPGRDTRVP